MPAFTISETKLYVSVANLSTQDIVKLLKQLESDFKRTTNWNKYQSKITMEAQKRYLYILIDSTFQGINRHFVLLFVNNDDWESKKGYFLPAAEIKDYKVMIDGRTFFDQPIKMIK